MTWDLTIASDERHARFIERALASGEVWVLSHRDEAGSWATSSCAMLDEEDEEIDVPIVPFWSDRAYAQRCAKDAWADYVPQSLPLAAFIEAVLRDMHEKGVMVGTNWNGDLVGHEAEAIELAQELYAALDAAGMLDHAGDGGDDGAGDGGEDADDRSEDPRTDGANA
jgi:hypothetical protein